MEDKKVVKVKNWKQLKEVKKTGFVPLEYPDCIMEVPIKSVSPNITDAIENKYDKLMPPVPTYFDNSLKKWFAITEDTLNPDHKKLYDEYAKETKKIETMKFAELVLAFLDIEIEGETLDEKVHNLREEIPVGHYYKIVQEGYKLSGIEVDRKVNEAKNF